MRMMKKRGTKAARMSRRGVVFKMGMRRMERVGKMGVLIRSTQTTHTATTNTTTKTTPPKTTPKTKINSTKTPTRTTSGGDENATIPEKQKIKRRNTPMVGLFSSHKKRTQRPLSGIAENDGLDNIGESEESEEDYDNTRRTDR